MCSFEGIIVISVGVSVSEKINTHDTHTNNNTRNSGGDCGGVTPVTDEHGRSSVLSGTGSAGSKDHLEHSS